MLTLLVRPSVCGRYVIGLGFISWAYMAWYSLFVLKVPLNTNQPISFTINSSHWNIFGHVLPISILLVLDKFVKNLPDVVTFELNNRLISRTVGYKCGRWFNRDVHFLHLRLRIVASRLPRLPHCVLVSSHPHHRGAGWQAARRRSTLALRQSEKREYRPLHGESSWFSFIIRGAPL